MRAAVGSPVQETNCHPFRHGRWLLVHNGLINDFHTLRRDLMLAVDPDRFADIEGSADSEVLLHLALTFGLEDDPLAGLERAIGFVEATARRHGIAPALQASIGVSDGESLWAVRYSTEGQHAHAVRVRRRRRDAPRCTRSARACSACSEGDRLIVSEPLVDLPGAWHEIPEATAVIIRPGGELERMAFTPRAPEA